MGENGSLRALRAALVMIGVVFMAGAYLLILMLWRHDGDKGAQMILGIYVTLGIFLILAVRRPFENLSLIWFAVWVNVARGGVMTIQGIEPDGPVLLVGAAVLAVLTLRAERARALSSPMAPVQRDLSA